MNTKQAEMYDLLLVICALTTELERHGINAVGMLTTEQSTDIVAIASELNDISTRDQQLAGMTRIYIGGIAKLIADYKTEVSTDEISHEVADNSAGI